MKKPASKPRSGDGESGHWSISVAKARLSDIVRLAREVGPQVLTSHGRQVAIVEAVGPATAMRGLREEAATYSTSREPKEKASRRPARFWSERSRRIGDDLVLPERTAVVHRDIDLE